MLEKYALSAEDREELIRDRRTLHGFAEVGFDLPQTIAYVVKRLRDFGCEPQFVGSAGVSCTVGSGRTILLRADMDALPMEETTGYPFSAKNGNSHSCGHDAHTAMLLTAAKLIKRDENELKGAVKFMFQPAEEQLAGALDMIGHGILDNPKIDAALALHVAAGSECAETGVVYCVEGPLTYSGDAYRITVAGREAHGSTPHLGVDAVHIAAQIVVALNAIVAREVAPSEQAVLLVGKMQGGTACNTVADSAILEATVRAKSVATRALLRRRLEEVSRQVAVTYGGEADPEYLYGMPPAINDPSLSSQMRGFCEELLGSERVRPLEQFVGSEDFAVIGERVPAVMFTIGFGGLSEGYQHSLHHASLDLNEEALPVGAAVYAYCARRWLEAGV